MVRTGTVPGWSREFDAWADEALARGDLDELSAFRDHAPGMPYAHPSVEHFTPLFVTLGAATADITTAIDGFFWDCQAFAAGGLRALRRVCHVPVESDRAGTCGQFTVRNGKEMTDRCSQGRLSSRVRCDCCGRGWPWPRSRPTS